MEYSKKEKMVVNLKWTDFSKNIDAEHGIIRSNTGQLVWNHKLGYCTLNAPKAQGVTGFLESAGGKFDFDNVTVTSDNRYAAVSVVSLDDKSLKESRKVLIQVGTTARLKDWKTKPVMIDFQKRKIPGLGIVNSGSPPWQIKDTKVTVTIRNTFLEKAHKVTIAGRDGGAIEMKRDKTGCTVRLPRDAMYVILTSE